MAPRLEAGLRRGWTSPAPAGGAIPGSGVRGWGGRCRLPRQRGGSWAKVQRGGVAGTWPQESVPLGQGGGACPGGRSSRETSQGRSEGSARLWGAGGGTREGPEAEQRAWWGREDQRATGVPAGFPRWTAGQVWPRGQRAAGGWGKPGVWPGGRRSVNQLTCARPGRC